MSHRAERHARLEVNHGQTRLDPPSPGTIAMDTLTSGLSISLFGVGRVAHNDARRYEHLPPGVRALLGYLVLNRDCPQRREAVADMFWSCEESDRARNRLSTALWRLRNVLEPEADDRGRYLTSTGPDDIQFKSSDDVWIDVACLERSTARISDRPVSELGAGEISDIESAVATYTGDLLEGIDAPWLAIERERYLQMYLAGQGKILSWYSSVGGYEQAIEAGEQILRRDPLREEVHRALIRLYGECGRRTAAIRQFETCRRHLREELDVMPLPETVAVAAWVAQGAAEPVSYDSSANRARLLEQVARAQEALSLAAAELKAVVEALSDRTI